MENSRLWATCCGVVAAALAMLPSPPAAAAEGARPPALCRYDVHDTATPGWWLTPSQGTAHGIGTITCVGLVHGKQLTGGPSRFEWWYSYGSSDVPLGGNTCLLAGGSGTWEADLPTADGAALPLTGSWRAIGSFAGEVHGDLGGLPARMVYESFVDPNHLDGNCVTAPVSQGRVIGEGTLG